MEHETFFTLLHDTAHWEFELFCNLIFDIVLWSIVWPFVHKHWKHHLSRDKKDGL